MSDPDETLSADEGEPGDQYTGGPHVQPRQPVSQAAVQDALPMGVNNFTFDFDSGILLQDEDGLVGVSHQQQVGVTEVGEGVADLPHDSTRRRRLSKREQKVEEKEKMCQKFRDALAAWNTGRYVSMRQCAEAFGVPRTSLNDMIREGRTEWRGKGGKSNKAKSTAKTVAKTTNKTPAARRKRASATVTSSSATATTVEPDQSGSNSQEAESEPVVKTNANEKKDSGAEDCRQGAEGQGGGLQQAA